MISSFINGSNQFNLFMSAYFISFKSIPIHNHEILMRENPARDTEPQIFQLMNRVNVKIGLMNKSIKKQQQKRNKKNNNGAPEI